MSAGLGPNRKHLHDPPDSKTASAQPSPESVHRFPLYFPDSSPPLAPPPAINSIIAGMKRPRCQLLLGIFSLLLSCCCPGILSSRIVTLGTIQIFNSHEILGSKPSVYFQCKGENKTSLPDVKKTSFLYSFKGEESWQPLTELPDKKCKRCGLYEADKLKPDDVFDEWELCPQDFVDGKYVHFKDSEVNATFICPQCAGSASQASGSVKEAAPRKSNTAVVIITCLLASMVAVIGSVAAYKYWQKRKREKDQARFLKLFEEGDDIEDELGLGYVI